MSAQAPSSLALEAVTEPPYKMRRLSETSAKKCQRVIYEGRHAQQTLCRVKLKILNQEQLKWRDSCAGAHN
jgi:hypothetical protein